MKLKEIKNLRSKEIKELEKLVNEKVAEIMKLKVRAKVSKEKNLKHVKMLRREVAQLLTIISEKKLIEKNALVQKSKEVKN